VWVSPDAAIAYRAEVGGEDIDLSPPERVVNAAEAGLEAKDEYSGEIGDCGTGVGEDMAEAIVNDELTPEIIASGGDIADNGPATYLESHESDVDAEGTPGEWGREEWTGGCAEVQQALWGFYADWFADKEAEVEDAMEQEAVGDGRDVTLRGAVASPRAGGGGGAGAPRPTTLTKANSNEVDVASLPAELEAAVTADEFYVYGKASIEQWDDDDPPTLIQMDALEAALDRYFGSDTAPGIISREHQDIPVGRPVEQFEFAEDTTLEIDGETYEFAAGDVARSHVEDADGDGQPELWLAAEIDGETEMGKKTRALVATGELNGFSVTVHRNRDEMTQEGRVVKECDLHAVTIGTDEQIKNPGSEFDFAEAKSALGEAWRRMRRVVSRG